MTSKTSFIILLAMLKLKRISHFIWVFLFGDMINYHIFIIILQNSRLLMHVIFLYTSVRYRCTIIEFFFVSVFKIIEWLAVITIRVYFLLICVGVSFSKIWYEWHLTAVIKFYLGTSFVYNSEYPFRMTMALFNFRFTMKPI